MNQTQMALSLEFLCEVLKQRSLSMRQRANAAQSYYNDLPKNSEARALWGDIALAAFFLSDEDADRVMRFFK